MAGGKSVLSRRALAVLILAGSERAGARLPTERQLAQDLGVSRSAIRHALAVLQAEGHISREVGRGTFLRGRIPDPGADGGQAYAGLEPPAGTAPPPGAAGGLPAS